MPARIRIRTAPAAGFECAFSGTSVFHVADTGAGNAVAGDGHVGGRIADGVHALAVLAGSEGDVGFWWWGAVVGERNAGKDVGSC